MDKNARLAITRREREVLHWVSQGRTKNEIAEILELSESSVKRHCENIFRKLESKTLASAVAKAVKMGLIDL